MGITNEKELCRALRGSQGTLWSFIIAAVVLVVLFLLAIPGSEPDNPETKNMYIVAAITLLIFIILAIFEGHRTRRARTVIRHLKKYGELEEALADLAGEDVWLLEKPYSKRTYLQRTALGRRFMFLFEEGMILHYYQLSSLRLSREADRMTLQAVTTTGKTLTVMYAPVGEDTETDECVSQLRSRYPGCPEVSRAPSPFRKPIKS